MNVSVVIIVREPSSSASVWKVELMLRARKASQPLIPAPNSPMQLNPHLDGAVKKSKIGLDWQVKLFCMKLSFGMQILVGK